MASADPNIVAAMARIVPKGWTAIPDWRLEGLLKTERFLRREVASLECTETIPGQLPEKDCSCLPCTARAHFGMRRKRAR